MNIIYIILFLSENGFVFQTVRVNEGGPKLRMGSACLLELQCVDCGKLSAKWISKSVNCGHCPSHCHPAFQQGFYSSS